MNEPTDRDSETHDAEVVATVAGYLRMWCGDSEKAESHATDIIKMVEVVARPADEERAVLAELLRLKTTTPPLMPTVQMNGYAEWRYEWRAAWDRAREVLARREKEGKDK